MKLHNKISGIFLLTLLAPATLFSMTKADYERQFSDALRTHNYGAAEAAINALAPQMSPQEINRLKERLHGAKTVSSYTPKRPTPAAAAPTYLEKETAGSIKAVHDANKRIDELNQEIKKLNDSLKDEKAQVAQLQELLKTANQNQPQEKLLNELAVTKTNLASAKQEAVNLKSEVGHLNTALADNNKHIHDLTEENRTLTADYNSASKKAEELKDTVKQMGALTSEQMEATATLQAEKQKLTKQAQDLISRDTLLRSKVNSATDLEALKKEVKNLK